MIARTLPRPILPRPILPALAHGVAACGIVASVAVLWTCLPGRPDATTALLTVAGIGGLAWLTAVGASTRRVAANDNDPGPRARLDWRPVDPDCTTVIFPEAGIDLRQARQD